MRFADELRGSEGEKCRVSGRQATIVAVHDGGEKATVQYNDDSCGVVHYTQVELEGEEA